MIVLLAFPVMVVLMVLQMTIFSRLPLLNGTADIILLTLISWALQEKVTHAWEWCLVGGIIVSLISAMPWFSPLAGYLIITAIARYLQKRIWQVPILMVFVLTLIGTIIQSGIAILVLQLDGRTINIQDSLSLIMLPSIMLNLLLALPIYTVISNLASLLYPIEVET